MKRRIVLFLILSVIAVSVSSCSDAVITDERTDVTSTSESQAESEPSIDLRRLIANSNNVWQYFNGSTSTPEYELIVNNIGADSVTFDIVVYRTDEFDNITAKVDSDGLLCFSNAPGQVDNTDISGSIEIGDGNIILNISEASHPYITSDTKVVFTEQTDISALR